MFDNQTFTKDAVVKELLGSYPPTNPTPHPYLRVTRRSVPRITWEAVRVVEGTHCGGLLLHMLANGDLIYPSQGGSYSAEGRMALG